MCLEQSDYNTVLFAPADDTTRRFLQDAIGGYIGTAVDRALGRHLPTGLLTAPAAVPPDALVLECDYRNGHVSLEERR